MAPRRDRLLADVLARIADGQPTAEVERWLAEQGYDPREIGEILSTAEHEVVSGESARPSPRLADRSVIPGEPPAIRVQGPHERGRFSAAAWGWILDLTGSGLVAGSDLETLIDRALFQIEGRIGVADLRSLAEELGIVPTAGDARPPSH